MEVGGIGGVWGEGGLEEVVGAEEAAAVGTPTGAGFVAHIVAPCTNTASWTLLPARSGIQLDTKVSN